MTDQPAEDDALAIGGIWTRLEHVTPALTMRHSLEIAQTSLKGRVFEISDTMLERLLTEAGYTLTEPATPTSPDTTQETP